MGVQQAIRQIQASSDLVDPRSQSFSLPPQSWIKTPTLYVMDCSHAGELLNHLLELNTDNMEDETEDVYFLGACGTSE